jgi:hypothetical protein
MVEWVVVSSVLAVEKWVGLWGLEDGWIGLIAADDAAGYGRL